MYSIVAKILSLHKLQNESECFHIYFAYCKQLLGLLYSQMVFPTFTCAYIHRCVFNVVSVIRGMASYHEATKAAASLKKLWFRLFKVLGEQMSLNDQN